MSLEPALPPRGAGSARGRGNGNWGHRRGGGRKTGRGGSDNSASMSTTRLECGSASSGRPHFAMWMQVSMSARSISGIFPRLRLSDQRVARATGGRRAVVETRSKTL